MCESVQAADYLNDPVALKLAMERLGEWLFDPQGSFKLSRKFPDTSGISHVRLQVGSYPTIYLARHTASQSSHLFLLLFNSVDWKATSQAGHVCHASPRTSSY